MNIVLFSIAELLHIQFHSEIQLFLTFISDGYGIQDLVYKRTVKDRVEATLDSYLILYLINNHL